MSNVKLVIAWIDCRPWLSSYGRVMTALWGDDRPGELEKARDYARKMQMDEARSCPIVRMAISGGFVTIADYRAIESECVRHALAELSEEYPLMALQIRRQNPDALPGLS